MYISNRIQKTRTPMSVYVYVLMIICMRVRFRLLRRLLVSVMEQVAVFSPYPSALCLCNRLAASSYHQPQSGHSSSPAPPLRPRTLFRRSWALSF